MSIKDSGKKRVWDTGANRDSAEGKLKMSLIPLEELQRVQQHFYDGGAKYGFDNWKKGLPLSEYYDSANRHLQAWYNGADDEDHMAAAVWNILCAMWTEQRLGDQDDRPNTPKQERKKEE